MGKLEELLNGFNHSHVYTRQRGSNLILKDLASKENSKVIPDMSCLRSTLFLLENFDRPKDKENVLHQGHGQLKAFREIAESGRMSVLPQIYQEFISFDDKFKKLVNNNLRRYGGDDNLAQGLLKLQDDNDALKYALYESVDPLLQKEAVKVLSYVDDQLVSTYTKSCNIEKFVSIPDKALYMASIISQDATSKKNPVYLLTADTDLMVQPPVSIGDFPFLSTPVYFPTGFYLDEALLRSFQRYEHEPKQSTIKNTG